MPVTLKKADVPGLRIVPTGSLVPHEEVDMHRSEPLVARLRSEGVLKNPPVVAPIHGEERYVVLDGTNRAVAMAVLACPHIVVQVVDYDDPDLILDTWFHLVTGMHAADFFGALQTVDGLRVQASNLTQARAELARRRAITYVITPPGRVSSGRAAESDGEVSVVYAAGDVRQRTAVLNQLVDVYQSRGRIHRTNTDHLEQLLPYYTEVMALVVFPRYEPSEIVELARQGAHLPPGITRHIVPGRALRLNFPLAALADDRSLEDKNAWLQDWMRQKLANGEMRYYQESTYLFDE